MSCSSLAHVHHAFVALVFVCSGAADVLPHVSCMFLVCSHHHQTHPDFPKKPLTPYFRFFMEKRAKYAKIHPEMSNLDLTKILSKKYKELPDKKKVRLLSQLIG